MKPKLLLCLALVLSGGLFGCSKSNEGQLPNNQSDQLLGKLLEIHSLKGRPTVAIYMRGFPDVSFSAYFVDDGASKLLFLTLPEMKSQFETITNSIVRDNHAKRVCADRNGVGMYDVFWSNDSQRLAIAFMGNFIAGYDCKTGQKIQVREGLDNKFQCQALGAVIQSFLDGNDFTEAEVADVRRHSYSNQDHHANP
jgi:hypothetical protein